MRLPLIKHTLDFIKKNDEDWVVEATEVLEHMAGAKGLKDEELEVIGKILSNLYGSIAVAEAIKEGTSRKKALNSFMQRVVGSIN